jgi:hypothetical protein
VQAPRLPQEHRALLFAAQGDDRVDLAGGEMSTPISFKTATASGRTLVGREPADHTWMPGGTMVRATPSAIWLRAEFATQRKRMPFTG